MKYLLDTHSLLWIITGNRILSKKALNIYLNEENDIFFSAASIWELAIKSSLNKINLGMNLDRFVEEHIRGNNIEILYISLPHLFRIEKLPFHHRDPFDRLIIAQALEDNLIIISKDKTFDRYNVKRIW